MMAFAYNPSTQETEEGESGVQGQPGLHSKLQASLNYIVRSCQKMKINKSINNSQTWRKYPTDEVLKYKELLKIEGQGSKNLTEEWVKRKSLAPSTFSSLSLPISLTIHRTLNVSSLFCDFTPFHNLCLECSFN
jgi:hypothetical protein